MSLYLVKIPELSKRDSKEAAEVQEKIDETLDGTESVDHFLDEVRIQGIDRTFLLIRKLIALLKKAHLRNTHELIDEMHVVKEPECNSCGYISTNAGEFCPRCGREISEKEVWTLDYFIDYAKERLQELK